MFVECTTSDEIVPENSSGPDAELSGFLGVDAVTDSNDSVEVVVLHCTFYNSTTLCLNCFHFGNS